LLSTDVFTESDALGAAFVVNAGFAGNVTFLLDLPLETALFSEEALLNSVSATPKLRGRRAFVGTRWRRMLDAYTLTVGTLPIDVT
jgi:hypothetical protein